MAAADITVQERIEYLEAAVELARAMQLKLEREVKRGSYQARREWDKYTAHINAMLEALSSLYFARDMTATPECETDELETRAD